MRRAAQQTSSLWEAARVLLLARSRLWSCTAFAFHILDDASAVNILGILLTVESNAVKDTVAGTTKRTFGIGRPDGRLGL